MQVCTDPFYPLSILHVYCTDTDTSLIWHLEQNIFILLYYCEAQGKGRAKGRPRKVTQRSFIDGGWWMVDGGYPFPDALH